MEVEDEDERLLEGKEGTFIQLFKLKSHCNHCAKVPESSGLVLPVRGGTCGIRDLRQN